MAKKHQEVDIQQEPLMVDMADSDPLYESEAYGAPQPEHGQNVTVMKQVGIGGPVPIIAPKHNTIQLQPIIVPLAVVPYMTQDSNVLRTDNRQPGGYDPDEEQSYREATEFGPVERRTSRTAKASKAAKKKRAVSFPRIFSAVSFFITALFLVPFFLSYKETGVGNMLIYEFDVIGIIKSWIQIGFNIETHAVSLVYVIVMGLAGIQLILTLLGIIIGKYPKPIASILSCLNTLSFVGLLVYVLIDKKQIFVPKLEIGFLVLLVFSALNFILSIVFSILLNRKEDREERKVKRNSEI